MLPNEMEEEAIQRQQPMKVISMQDVEKTMSKKLFLMENFKRTLPKN